MSMSGSFDRFTERARKVLTLAQEEAQRFNHNYIGTEHLLLGLVREGEGVAAKVLSNLGIELTKVRSAVEFIIGRGERQVIGEIGLTPRAKGHRTCSRRGAAAWSPLYRHGTLTSWPDSRRRRHSRGRAREPGR
jgi:ATP-dependent Clp protease ATP-binding subunit ClpA